MRNVTLVLEDGTKFHGQSFGYDAPVAGEVVFNTAMMGYPESLTDPSYAGQLMALTYPLVGNYGVSPFTFEANGLPSFMESDKIYASAIIVSDYSEQFSHWNAVESLADWLKREKVPGITGIDTRQLTKVLREHGVMMGKTSSIRLAVRRLSVTMRALVRRSYSSIVALRQTSFAASSTAEWKLFVFLGTTITQTWISMDCSLLTALATQICAVRL